MLLHKQAPTVAQYACKDEYPDSICGKSPTSNFCSVSKKSLPINEEVYLFIVSTLYCGLMCLKIRIN
jgi:hypothetical protein